MGQPTTKDLAKAAGVSLATVDRVLNTRTGVRQATVERVNRASENIGYVRDLSAANLARSKEYKLVFVLPDHNDQFIERICRSIEEARVALGRERTILSIIQFPSNDPHKTVHEIDKIANTGVDGIAIMAPETPQVRDAISRLNAKDIAVVAFISSQANAENAYFVGVNNKAAGRTVGQIMNRFTGKRDGTVLVLTETMQSRNSQERRLGFDSILAKHTARLVVSPSMETYGDPDRTAQIMSTAINNSSPIVGIYLMNHDIFETMEVIQKEKRLKDAVIIGHELTPHTRTRLIDGSMDAIIAQDVGHLVRSSIRVLRAKVEKTLTVASQERIRIEIMLRENMPED